MKNKISLGVDVGSTTTKLAAIMDGHVLNTIYLKNRPGLERVSGCNRYSCNSCTDGCSTGFILNSACGFVDSLKEKHPNIEVHACVVTGSQMNNRRVLGELNKRYRTAYVTEIFAHASGVEFLLPEKSLKSAIIDIGGQDSKIIITDGISRLDENGKKNEICVLDSAMNEMCAAGTGAYFDSLAEFIDIPIEDFGRLAIRGFGKLKEKIISSHCATFARAMFARLQQEHTREELAAAACRAQAEIILSLAAPKLRKYNRERIIFQGGVASNEGMVHALRDVFKKRIIVPGHGQVKEANKVMGALGTAYMAEKYADFINENFRFAGTGRVSDE